MQVHQTKKSNKWECKLCGEKQSIKRHFGLGTGKECRLHVQKLNGIKGEVVEINEAAKLNESSDDDVSNEGTGVPNKRQTHNLKSKWSEFVDITEDVKVTEPESMYIGNAEVVLEVPAKRRKFAKPKITKNTSVSVEVNTYPSTTNCFERVQGSIETQMSTVKKNIQVLNATFTGHDQLKVTSRETEFLQPETRAEMKTFVPHKVVINSKWAQFTDESDRESYSCEEDLSFALCNYENSTVTNDAQKPNNDHEICKHKNTEKNRKVQAKSLFTLCNEDDLDDVLDF